MTIEQLEKLLGKGVLLGKETPVSEVCSSKQEEEENEEDEEDEDEDDWATL